MSNGQQTRKVNATVAIEIPLGKGTNALCCLQAMIEQVIVHAASNMGASDVEIEHALKGALARHKELAGHHLTVKKDDDRINLNFEPPSDTWVSAKSVLPDSNINRL